MSTSEILLKVWGIRDWWSNFITGRLLRKYESSCDSWWPILNTIVPPALFIHITCLLVSGLTFWFLLLEQQSVLLAWSSFLYRWETSLIRVTSHFINLFKKSSLSLLSYAFFKTFTEVSDDDLGYLYAYLFASHIKQKGIC